MSNLTGPDILKFLDKRVDLEVFATSDPSKVQMQRGRVVIDDGVLSLQTGPTKVVPLFQEGFAYRSVREVSRPRAESVESARRESASRVRAQPAPFDFFGATPLEQPEAASPPGQLDRILVKIRALASRLDAVESRPAEGTQRGGIPRAGSRADLPTAGYFVAVDEEQRKADYHRDDARPKMVMAGPLQMVSVVRTEFRAFAIPLYMATSIYKDNNAILADWRADLAAARDAHPATQAGNASLREYTRLQLNLAKQMVEAYLLNPGPKPSTPEEWVLPIMLGANMGALMWAASGQSGSAVYKAVDKQLNEEFVVDVNKWFKSSNQTNNKSDQK